MIIKRIVAIALITTFTALTVIIIGGLFVPVSFFSRLMNEDIKSTPTEVIIVDANGNEIADAHIVTNEDGSTTVVSASGEVIENAGSATVPVDSGNTSNPIATGSSPTVPPTTPPATPPATPPSTPPTTPTPPAPPACGSGGNCTSAQVASHNTQSNCWVIYNNKVYNVTTFVSRHEGGSQVFNSNTCGKDIGQYLSGTREPTSGLRHTHTSSDISDINPYFIANLVG